MVDNLTATVMSVGGGVYRLWHDERVIDASLRGRMKNKSRDQVIVGDRVTIGVDESGSFTIESVLPRKNVLRRRMPGGRRGTREIAANLDGVVVVSSLTQPEWDPRLVDRFLVVAEANELPICLVANKMDLSSQDDGELDLYKRIGYPVIRTSAKTGVGVDALRKHLLGRVTLVTGPTGVGKSSLLNAVQSDLRLRTAAVSTKSHSGRHTTVAATMYPLEGGGYVVDTPGLRDMGLWAVDRSDVEKAFPEFREASQSCRFDDCTHGQEPHCGVKQAAEDGRIAESRLASYRQMLAEAEALPRW